VQDQVDVDKGKKRRSASGGGGGLDKFEEIKVGLISKCFLL